jgi:hypothetical protein
VQYCLPSPRTLTTPTDAICAASLTTICGQPTPLSSGHQGRAKRIRCTLSRHVPQWTRANGLAQSGKSIFLRSIDDPAVSKQYTQHTTQTTVARFSPAGFYVPSGYVSGTVTVWTARERARPKVRRLAAAAGTSGKVKLTGSTGDYHIIAGRINDIAWDGGSQRIIAVGDGKERFGHCITADGSNSVGEISGRTSQINCVSIR